MAKQGVSHGGLGVLAKHRKRQRLNSVLSTLRTLKTLVRSITGCSSVHTMPLSAND